MPGTPERVLVVDDERDLAESCRFFLDRAGYDCAVAFSGEAALDWIDRQGAPELVVTDLRMPEMTGLKLLEAIKSRSRDTEVLLITGYPAIDTAVRAIKLGAADYIAKPFREPELLEKVEAVLAARKERLGKPHKDDAALLETSSPAFRACLEVVERAGRTDASVLILGESGTGKEVLARYLHRCSQREQQPFVPVDCATIPENLMESELFGHKRGAFSGAERDRVGMFQAAHGGTIFLDEVGELPLPFQPKLLRALQERQVRRVGGQRWEKVDVRVVAATNRALQEEVEAGRFREDLFYRLDVVRVTVPPLRDRHEDLPALAEHLLRVIAKRDGAAPRRLDPAALQVLRGFSWPGNVRQFRNVLERACALGQGEVIRAEDLPQELLGQKEALEDADFQETFQEMKQRKIAAIETTYVETLLKRHGGNVTRCAEDAGMSRSAFQRLMQRYGIRSQDYRDE